MSAVADISPRSTWEARGGTGARVRVIAAASGYVTFGATGCLPVTLHHVEFRRQFEPLYDRRKVRSQFSMTLANLGEFQVFWIPGRRTIAARSVGCSRRFALPAGAVSVGVYAQPFDSEEFLGDLDDVLAKLEASRRHAGGCPRT